MCYVQSSLSIVVLVVSICYNVFNQIRSGQPVQIDFELIGLAMSKEVYWAQNGLDPTLKGINFVQCYQQWAITITIIIVFNSQVNLCCHFSFCNGRWYTLHVLIFNSKSLNSTVGTVLSFFVALYIALSRSLASDEIQLQFCQYWGYCIQLLFEDFFCYHCWPVLQSVSG